MLDRKALIRLDVGSMVFVSGDIHYVKWKKFDQIHVSLRLFLFAWTHTGLSKRWRIFVDCNPLVVVVDLMVLAASEHLGKSEIWARDRLKCWWRPHLPVGWLT